MCEVFGPFRSSRVVCFFFLGLGGKKKALKPVSPSSPADADNEFVDDGARTSLDAGGQPKDTDFDITKKSKKVVVENKSAAAAAQDGTGTVKKERRTSAIALSQIPTVLEVVVHAQCSMFAQKHGAKGECRARAVAELLVKGIFVTADFLFQKVNEWIDTFEEELGKEETGNKTVVFEGNNVQLQQLSQQRTVFRRKKADSKEVKAELSVKAAAGVAIRGAVSSRIESQFALQRTDFEEKEGVREDAKRKSLGVGGESEEKEAILESDGLGVIAKKQKKTTTAKKEKESKRSSKRGLFAVVCLLCFSYFQIMEVDPLAALKAIQEEKMAFKREQADRLEQARVDELNFRREELKVRQEEAAIKREELKIMQNARFPRLE